VGLSYIYHAFFFEDLGHGDLGAYGHPTSLTPNLNRFAREGQKLYQYYSAANICSPSRGSILTGRHYARLGVYPGVFSPNSNSGLQLTEITMAKMLKQQGYVTGALGKWHLGTKEYHPTAHGFDRYYGAPMTQNECYSNIHNPGSTTPTGPFGPCPFFNGSTNTPDSIQSQGNGTFPADKWAVDMLEVDSMYDQAVEEFIVNATTPSSLTGPATTPFFFYFASHHTHVPQFAGKVGTNLTRRGLFGDSLWYLDRSVGRIMDVLDRQGVTNNTLIVFSADNGGSLHWHGTPFISTANSFGCNFVVCVNNLLQIEP
jgi:arylsulfatase A